MNTLFLIPARGGSKGLPGKNIMPLQGKPLILYSIELARQFSSDDMICVSTDEQEIIEVVNSVDLPVPFIRPPDLATDEANSYDVMCHAINEYALKGKQIDNLVLLQPTSPLRKSIHLEEAMALYHKDIDAVVSVKQSHSNPYFSLFEEGDNGYLEKSKELHITRRQDAPPVYEFNGAIYIVNTMSIKRYKSISELPKIVKYIMPKENSVDIDDLTDFKYCEFLMDQGIIAL